MVGNPTAILSGAAAVFAAALLGCAPQNHFLDSKSQFPDALVDRALKQVSYQQEVEPTHCQVATSAPFAIDTDSSAIDYWDLTLDDAIQLALANSTVLRDLGARIIQAPSLTSTIYDPSIVATDPRFGAEGALSAFDAQFSTRLFYEKNDRALNNALLGGGTNFFVQDLSQFQSELKKRAVTGTEFSLRHNVEDDLNNAPDNIFGTAGSIDKQAWNWNVEAEIRQPLMQGSGVEFNRIAGPDAVPGIANGVVIAQMNQDISAAEFQIAVRDYLSNVENAYWELVFAYRDLEAKKKARDRSLETWQEMLAKHEMQGAEADRVAQAAEQYYRFQEQVETALSGQQLEGTRDFNGSTGGTFQGTGGVYVAERRLRLILGIPINDHRLIRPVTEPLPAKVILNWDQLANEALAQRTELVRQRLRVKRRNLECIASRNFLLPRFDAVGRYRRRGLGDNLYDPSVPDPAMPTQFVDSGNDEWQVGLEFAMPLGFRQASAGVRNSQLALARERAVLTEMERQVIHDLSNAVAEQARGYQLVQTAYNRRVEAEKQFEILTSQDVGAARRSIDYNTRLDAVSRLSEAETGYNRALIGYEVALKNVHVEIGDLMKYCNVYYSEGR